MKYHNEKTEVAGIKFDSKKEADRYVVLKALENLGAIQNLRRQVRYKLTTGKRWSNGKKHRAVEYVADFVYILDGEEIVEDVKGFKTPVYKIKRELMKEKYDIEISEV